MIFRNNVSFLAIIQARLSSSRLPGKVLLPFPHLPIIHFLANRLKENNSTVINSTHDPENFDFVDHHIQIEHKQLYIQIHSFTIKHFVH